MQLRPVCCPARPSPAAAADHLAVCPRRLSSAYKPCAPAVLGNSSSTLSFSPFPVFLWFPPLPPSSEKRHHLIILKNGRHQDLLRQPVVAVHRGEWYTAQKDGLSGGSGARGRVQRERRGVLRRPGPFGVDAHLFFRPLALPVGARAGSASAPIMVTATRCSCPGAAMTCCRQDQAAAKGRRPPCARAQGCGVAPIARAVALLPAAQPRLMLSLIRSPCCAAAAKMGGSLSHHTLPQVLHGAYTRKDCPSSPPPTSAPL